MDSVFLYFFLFAFLSPCTLGLTRLIERFSWKVLDYDYPSAQARKQAIDNGDFIPKYNIPTGLAVWNDRMFIITPRWRKGVPSGLNYVNLAENSTSPKLRPYPNWEVSKQGNCEGITTPSRVRIDKCNRLWVFDSGSLELDEGIVHLCPFAIHIYDLKTDKKIRRYELKPSDTKPLTTVASIELDDGDTCDDVFMYASDITEFGMIVYSFKDNDSWRFDHSYFMPDPLAEDYNISGLNFQWKREGIFGLALSPKRNNAHRTLFFHALSSCKKFYVSTEVLKNKTMRNYYHDFHVLPERGPDCHVTSQVMDENGILFFNMIDENAIGCWNTNKMYGKENRQILAKNEHLVFPSDLYLDRNQIFWVISNRLPRFLEYTMNFEETNFRVYYIPKKDLLSNSICVL